MKKRKSNKSNELLTAIALILIGGLFIIYVLAGWLFVTLALYVLGAFLLIAGITQLIAISKLKIKKLTLPAVMHIAQPVIYILVAICLFFNQGGAISWVFILSGVFLILDGIAGIIGALDK